MVIVSSWPFLTTQASSLAVVRAVLCLTYCSMEMRVELSFSIQPLNYHPEVLSLAPVLSGTPLAELISLFETDRGFEPAGGYSLERYFMGEIEDDYLVDGCYLLGCGDCGEVGCWPLRGRVRKTGDLMIWDSFTQPHRPQRDYSDFGPFVFDVEPYRSAVFEAAARFKQT